jgi:hypothetical protein
MSVAIVQKNRSLKYKHVLRNHLHFATGLPSPPPPPYSFVTVCSKSTQKEICLSKQVQIIPTKLAEGCHQSLSRQHSTDTRVLWQKSVQSGRQECQCSTLKTETTAASVTLVSLHQHTWPHTQNTYISAVTHRCGNVTPHLCQFRSES